MSTAPRPLDGYRVLDFTQNVAGPLGGQVLADLGAEVIKVEAPGGEAARRIVAVVGSKPIASYFLPNNRGKKSVMVDLTTEEGREQILALCDTADVVLESFRPGVMEKLGLGPETVKARNPRLVYASVSAYGGNGPHGGRPGIDLLVQAESGMLSGMRTAEGGPQIIPFQLVDGATGHVLAQAVLAALLHRERHGVADIVRVSMYDVAVSLQANQLTLHLNTEPRSERPRDEKPKNGRKKVAFATQPSDAFKASDGYFVLSAYVPKHWAKLCEVIGRPELTEDPRFGDQKARSVNYYEMKDELNATFAAKTAEEWVRILHEAGLMATIVYNWKQVVQTPLFAENELAVTVGEDQRAVTVIRTPARFASFASAANAPAPLPGEHNDELLVGEAVEA